MLNVGNEGMIHWLTINFIIPATPSNPSSNPTFSTSKFVHHEKWCLGDVDENTMMVHMLFFHRKMMDWPIYLFFSQQHLNFPYENMLAFSHQNGILYEWAEKYIFRLIIHIIYTYYIYNIYTYIYVNFYVSSMNILYSDSLEQFQGDLFEPGGRWSHE